MGQIIIFTDGQQLLVDETQIKIYDPFPEKEKNKDEPKENQDND